MRWTLIANCLGYNTKWTLLLIYYARFLNHIDYFIPRTSCTHFTLTRIIIQRQAPSRGGSMDLLGKRIKDFFFFFCDIFFSDFFELYSSSFNNLNILICQKKKKKIPINPSQAADSASNFLMMQRIQQDKYYKISTEVRKWQAWMHDLLNTKWKHL